MPSANMLSRSLPHKSYWFFGTWLLILAWGMSVHHLPKSQVNEGFIYYFWGLVAISLILVYTSGRLVLAWWRRPLMYRDRASPEALAAPVAASRLPKVALGWLTMGMLGLSWTLGRMPFSREARLLTGLVGRNIQLPTADRMAADIFPADVYLLPTLGFPEAAVPPLAKWLREETGILVAALPAEDLPGLQMHARWKNTPKFESMSSAIYTRATKLMLPAQPRPHAPLLIVLGSENPVFFTDRERVRFRFAHGFTRVTAFLSSRELMSSLPLEDAKAQVCLQDRVRKMLLILISHQVFGRFGEGDPKDSKLLIAKAPQSIFELDKRNAFLPYNPIEELNLKKAAAAAAATRGP